MSDLSKIYETIELAANNRCLFVFSFFVYIFAENVKKMCFCVGYLCLGKQAKDKTKKVSRKCEQKKAKKNCVTICYNVLQSSFVTIPLCVFVFVFVLQKFKG